MSTLTFGNVKHPAYTRKIVPKPWEGAGFTRVAPRKPIGTCEHRTWGMGTVEDIYALFATGGERQGDALTDYVIGLDGRIWMLNDPLGDRSPYANGGSDGLEGDGVPFVRAMGASAINSGLVSIENIGRPDTPFAGPQFESCAALMAHWHDRVRCPWDQFPYNPIYRIVTDLQHYEFATKDCPFPAFRARTDALQDRVRAILKAGQTGGAPATSVPIPKPVVVDHETLPGGLTVADATARFGTVTKIAPDGKRTTGGFDKNGIVSNAWLKRGAEERVYPKDVTIYQLDPDPKGTGDERQIAVFGNGWTLFSKAAFASWEWVA